MAGSEQSSARAWTVQGCPSLGLHGCDLTLPMIDWIADKLPPTIMVSIEVCKVHTCPVTVALYCGRSRHVCSGNIRQTSDKHVAEIFCLMGIAFEPQKKAVL